MTTVSKKSEQKRLHSCVFAQSKEVKIRQKLGLYRCYCKTRNFSCVMTRKLSDS